MRLSSWRTSHKWARSALRLATPANRRSSLHLRSVAAPHRRRAWLAAGGGPASASPPLSQVDEIFGTIQEVFFTVKPSEGVTATSFKVGNLAHTHPHRLPLGP